ncbi:hypothetical protein NPIL_411961 [Nephila pilipes]|uniref:Uncharacterized protein n=1 Tax=Nephila pilipes TaxID=299642 RepID=A0A8X6Q525_NEPPI|nr:hypothetical protein NPIL_411961 [Nephila pilipes]
MISENNNQWTSKPSETCSRCKNSSEYFGGCLEPLTTPLQFNSTIHNPVTWQQNQVQVNECHNQQLTISEVKILAKRKKKDNLTAQQKANPGNTRAAFNEWEHYVTCDPKIPPAQKKRSSGSPSDG